METLPYSNNISFISINKRPRINKGLLVNWLNSVAVNEGKNIINLSVNFCSDEYLWGMNKEFLNHDYYTDIITFDLSDKKQLIEGDLYISVDRVKENAQNIGVSLNEELFRVIVHGLLHLIGYGDKTMKEKKLMRNKENLYLEYLKIKPISRETLL